MGKLSKGILGGFSGTVGTVVGSNWRGIDCIRSRATSRRSTNTPGQQAQRAKFALGAKFLQSMRDLLTIGYRSFAIRMTGTNNALSHTLKGAVTGVYPDIRIDYSKVMISRGSLPNADAPAAVPGDAGKIRFNWTNTANVGKAKPGDTVLLVAYCEALNRSVYFFGSQRNAGTEILDAPGFSGQAVQTWISFISEDKKDIASSIFTGQVAVA